MLRIGRNDAEGVIPECFYRGSALYGNSLVPDKNIRGRHDSYRNHVGFSLIEVMIAVSILAFGTVVIHQSFLRSASHFGRYANQLKVSLWMNEKLWEAEEASLYAATGEEETGSKEGEASFGGRGYFWHQRVESREEQDLYRLLLDTQGKEGASSVNLIKEIYAFKKEPPKG